VITRKQAEDIQERVVELAKTFDELMGEQFASMGPGMRSLTDVQYEAWFTMKVEANPNWALALPFVEGGMAELRRWERIQEARNGGN